MVHHITGQEAKERCEKGLCYYCDERYVPGHRCQHPQFFVIEDCLANIDGDEEQESNDQCTNETLPEISFMLWRERFIPKLYG